MQLCVWYNWSVKVAMCVIQLLGKGSYVCDTTALVKPIQYLEQDILRWIKMAKIANIVKSLESWIAKTCCEDRNHATEEYLPAQPLIPEGWHLQ